MNSEAIKLKALVSLWYIDLESRYIPDSGTAGPHGVVCSVF